MRFTNYPKGIEVFAALPALAVAAIGAFFGVENMLPAMLVLAVFVVSRINALHEMEERKKEQERTQKHQERIEKLLEGISAQK